MKPSIGAGFSDFGIFLIGFYFKKEPRIIHP